MYVGVELEAFMKENSCQVQGEFELTLGVTPQAVSYRLKSLGMIQKRKNWLPYELKPKSVQYRFCTFEILLARHKRKFLHIVIADEK